MTIQYKMDVMFVDSSRLKDRLRKNGITGVEIAFKSYEWLEIGKLKMGIDTTPIERAIDLEYVRVARECKEVGIK